MQLFMLKISSLKVKGKERSQEEGVGVKTLTSTENFLQLVSFAQKTDPILEDIFCWFEVSYISIT